MRKRKYSSKIDSQEQTYYFLAPYTKITKSPEGNSLNPVKGQVQVIDINLSEERYQFNSNKDPISALNIFVKCVEKGYYPPAEVLEFLRDKFDKYLYSEKSLDSIMNLTRRAKKAARIRRRNIKIITEIDTLIHYFKVNISDAIEAVSRRYEARCIDIKPENIFDIYHRDGKKQLENSLMLKHNDLKWLDAMSEELRNKKLKTLFNKYPDDVKDRLKSNYDLPFL